MLQFSLLLLVFVLIIVLFLGMAEIQAFPLQLNTYVSLFLASILIIASITGIGIFEANALQFGMDQLLEASSSQLSAFVHWYF